MRTGAFSRIYIHLISLFVNKLNFICVNYKKGVGKVEFICIFSFFCRDTQVTCKFFMSLTYKRIFLSDDHKK